MMQAHDTDALRGAVASRDLTQRELARLAEISPAMITFILAGGPCQDVTARRIARSLRRRTGELFAVAMSSSRQRQEPQRAAG